jgi:glycosyltransferase involved in cell wall biosynthesis
VVQGFGSLTKTRPLRVAFPSIPRKLWAGGYNYQCNLFSALRRHCVGEITPVVFAGLADDPGELAELSRIPAVEVLRSRTFAFEDRHSRLPAAMILGLDRAAAAEFRSRRIDVVFENGRFFGWRSPFPAIAWFPDFQHGQLPQLFSRGARWRRELGFRAQIMSGRHILLSSESALADLRKYYPRMTNEVSVVRFASQPEAALLTGDIAKTLTEYKLPQRYFYLPNQFYRHKNHQVVIDALTILKERGCDIVIAASGSPKDLRGEGYFENLMRQVKARGLEMNFRYLGILPLDHVYALLRACVALINPSRFEGWSTTVEEAKSFGVPLILSNIEVHREQAGSSARYFGLEDAATLAEELWEAQQAAGPPVARDLLANVEQRVASFARDFARVAHAAAKRSER